MLHVLSGLPFFGLNTNRELNCTEYYTDVTQIFPYEWSHCYHVFVEGTIKSCNENVYCLFLYKELNMNKIGKFQKNSLYRDEVLKIFSLVENYSSDSYYSCSFKILLKGWIAEEKLTVKVLWKFLLPHLWDHFQFTTCHWIETSHC